MFVLKKKNQKVQNVTFILGRNGVFLQSKAVTKVFCKYSGVYFNVKCAFGGFLNLGRKNQKSAVEVKVNKVENEAEIEA